MFAEVALAVPLKRFFDYKVGDQPVVVGGRVVVPFAGQSKVGIVCRIKTNSDFAENKIKKIESVVDLQPLFSEHLMQLLAWLHHYYLAPPGEVYLNLLPKLLKNGLPAEPKQVSLWQLKENAEPPPARAFKQLALYHFLAKAGPTEQSLLRADGFSASLIRQMADNQYIVQHTRSHIDKKVTYHDSEYPLTEQQLAVIQQVQNHQGFNVYLLDGVTGSGKTEVYIQLMRAHLAAGQQVLVLVPEIGLTPQTLRRFQARFKCQVALIHSALNDSERHNAWLEAASGRARILIGTRSAVLTPMPDLGLIILDEEHDASYKQLDSLRYNARDVAVKRASLTQCPIVLGSATPSLETWVNAKNGKYLYLCLNQRVSKRQPPKPVLLDIKDRNLQAGLAYESIQMIEQHLKQGDQVLVFLNRRGYSPAIICHECGWICECQRCDSHYTYHKSIGQLICHHCGDQQKPPHQCEMCGSSQIVDWGVGTEQLADWLQERFVEYQVARIDRDSTRKKGALDKQLQAIESGEIQLLVGTQMLAKGHHFPNLTLAIVVNLDNALYSADFRAVERMAQLLVQVSGRAGRGVKKGQVVLQTHFPDHPYLQTLLAQGYSAFLDMLMQERQQAGFPPFTQWAALRLESHQKQLTEKKAVWIENLFNEYIQPHYQGLSLFASMPALHEKKAGKYRYLMLFSAERRAVLHAGIKQLQDSLLMNKSMQNVRWLIEIDPVSIQG
ncbi:primosomal protein N' [Gayadomonas joobiniege]|uniref:primosomal protein N' n=1 Tax=Gayadomonas joobiniege TaxID=1234606 RepID=UPI00037BDD98|nr:primosomal protein N' [Gayadomonas joobiniege]